MDQDKDSFEGVNLVGSAESPSCWSAECGAADGALRELLAENRQAHRAHIANAQRPLVAETRGAEVHAHGLVHPQHAARDRVRAQACQ